MAAGQRVLAGVAPIASDCDLHTSTLKVFVVVGGASLDKVASTRYRRR
jgi:hypothetical protein